MSDQTPTPNENEHVHTAPVTEEVTTAPVEDTPASRQPPKAGQEHTKHNTTCKCSVPNETPKMKDVDDLSTKDAIPVFLGTHKKDVFRYVELLALLDTLRSTQEEIKNKNKPPSALAGPTEDYQNFVAEHFSDMEPGEVDRIIGRFMDFQRRYADHSVIRNEMTETRNWESRTEFADGLVQRDVQPLLPNINTKGLSMAEQMERLSSHTADDPLAFDILIRDSYLQIRVQRSDVLELGQLVGDMYKEVKGYTRELNGNSLSLARVAMYRVFWNFVVNKITRCSVKGITDFRELAQIINFQDLNEIFASYIEEATNTGVPFLLTCVKDNCGWEALTSLDPSILKNHDKQKLTPKQAAALGNIRNGVATARYSKEDIEKLKADSPAIEGGDIYFDNNRQFIRIGKATIAEALTAYDVFMEKMEPRIADLRNEHIDNGQYMLALQNLLNSYRVMEYIHWVKEFHILPGENSEGEKRVFTREEDPAQFFESIINIMNRPQNIDLSRNLIMHVNRHGAEYSTTIIGVPNFVCPKCKENSGEEDSKGVTPIDPFMTFFILVRLSLLRRQYELVTAE